MLNVCTPEEALNIIRREFAGSAAETEVLPLSACLGRVLAEDITANEYVPDFDRSTVDGYAVRASDTFGCSDSTPAILKLRGIVGMGKAVEIAVATMEERTAKEREMRDYLIDRILRNENGGI